MEKVEQTKFVKRITNKIQEEIVTKIIENKIPENWGEDELLEFIAYKFRDETLKIKYPYMDLSFYSKLK